MKDGMIPLEKAWDTPLAFYIYFIDGAQEYWLIPRNRRDEFNEKFNAEVGKAVESTIPGIPVLRNLCKDYGRLMTENQFEKISKQVIGFSTSGIEGYRKYAVTGVDIQ